MRRSLSGPACIALFELQSPGEPGNRWDLASRLEMLHTTTGIEQEQRISSCRTLRGSTIKDPGHP